MSGCDSESLTEENVINLLEEIYFEDIIKVYSSLISDQNDSNTFSVPARIVFFISIVIFGLTLLIGIAFRFKAPARKNLNRKKRCITSCMFMI